MKVLHLARKLLPTTASFIYNQIAFHQDFTPGIVYCETVPSVFSKILFNNYETFCAVQSKLNTYVYKYLRVLTSDDNRRVAEFIKNSGADLLHVHYGVDALTYFNIIHLAGIPVVVSFYGYDCTSFPFRFNGLGKHLLQQQVFSNKHITAITAMSTDMKTDLEKIGCPPEKIIVHYHGTDTKPFYRQHLYTDSNIIHYLIISSLTAKKGHLFLLQAFQKASEKSRRKLFLHIVGDGELRKPLEQYISKAGITNVQLYGPVDYNSQRHHEFLQMADVFIHPSVTTSKGEKEGIPGALMEAMASGLPVISTRHAGIPHVIRHGQTGLLADEWNVAELTECILQMAHNFDKRRQLATEGQQYVVKNLDVRIKENDLEAIYQRVILGKDTQQAVKQEIV